jgi:hypothetical protein
MRRKRLDDGLVKGTSVSLGFNSKLQLADGLYDVQTEDRGLDHPFIDTLVLFQGQILHRCSRAYTDMLTSGAVEPQALRARVEQQHREVLDALRGGSLLLEKAAPTEAPALSIKLCNAGSWLVAGKASLEIEVSKRRDGRSVSGATVEVSIQGAAAGSTGVFEQTGEDGRALVRFSLPEIAKPEDAALVIEAHLGEMRGQIRYRLKPKSHERGPARK